LNSFNFFKTKVIYGTSDADRSWSSAAKRHIGCSPALIKAGNLKGLLGCPMCELFGYTSVILGIGDENIC